MAGLPADAPRDDRELLRDMAKDLQFIKEKIESKDGILAILKKHDERITTLETWRWKMIGVFAAISISLSIVTLVLVFYGRLLDLGIVRP